VSAPEMLSHLSGPVKSEMGTQNHSYPHNGEPGPQYDWRATAVRWYHHWLSGKDTGILKEPMNTAFMRDFVPADNKLKMTPGRFWATDKEFKTEPLVFDSIALKDTKYILGHPKVTLKTAADGLFHSSDYVSRLEPKDFPINQFMTLEIPLHYTSWTLSRT
jgi:hypothetical protein